MSGPVLLCFDGSEDAAHAIEEAGRVLRPGPAIVLTGWRPVVYAMGGYGAAMGTPADTTEVDRQIRESSTDAAADGVRRAEAAGFSAESLVVEATGPIWSSVVQCAEERDAAAIVVGSRGLGGFKSALLGSVSHGVVQHARRPVLVVPPPDAGS